MNDGFETLWKLVGGIFAAFAVIALFLGMLVGAGFTFVLLLAVAIGAAIVVFNLFSAKAQAIAHGQADAIAGFCKIISWNPAEGVLFLKNKNIAFVDDDPTDGGGLKAIFPISGDELACRVPLEIQTLNFEDDEVLTKEFLPLKIKGTIYWKISKLTDFYLSVNKNDIRVGSVDQGGHVTAGVGSQMNTAKSWLKAMAEEKTRSVVSNIGTGLLIADRLSADIPDMLPKQIFPSNRTESSDDYRTATDGLAAALTHSVGSAVQSYGIGVERIALQEVNLPPQIYAAAVEASRASYEPIKARAEALAKQMSLQAEVSVLGAEVVGLREISANIPAMAFQDVLGPTFARLAASLASGAQKSIGST